MFFSENVRFSSTHRWVEKIGSQYKIGFTPFLQDELGDISFVALPAVGDVVIANEPFIGVEASKAVTELSLPLNGEVVTVHEELSDSPELLNDSNVGNAWLVILEDVAEQEYGALMDKQVYDTFLSGELPNCK